MHQSRKHIRLEPVSRVPTKVDLQNLLGQGDKNRSFTVELPFYSDAGRFSLTVRVEPNADLDKRFRSDVPTPDPCWTLYSAAPESRVIWTRSSADTEIIYEFLHFSLPGILAQQRSRMTMQGRPALQPSSTSQTSLQAPAHPQAYFQGMQPSQGASPEGSPRTTMQGSPRASMQAPPPPPQAQAPPPPPQAQMPANVPQPWGRYIVSADDLMHVGKHAEAEQYLMLALNEANGFGEGDPKTLETLDRLAKCLARQEKWAEAAEAYKIKLEIQKNVLGPTHLDVAATLKCLCDLHQLQGDYAALEPLWVERLIIYEKNHGPDHPDVADMIFNLALFYHALQVYENAEELYQKALTIKQKLYGYKHPEVRRIIEEYARMLEECERYEEAELLFQESQTTASGLWRTVSGAEKANKSMQQSGVFDKFKPK
ncbi:MAG TPA: tetratricopeptide repeat protein [Candidatus Obscuribacterales bacterium]